MNTITMLRLPDGREVGFADWQDTPLFSTIDFLNGFTDQEIDCFTYVPGDQVPVTQNAVASRTATEEDTNLSTPGAMASTEEMLVYSIRPILWWQSLVSPFNDPNTGASTLFPQPAITANIAAAFGEQLNLYLTVSQKYEHSAPLAYYNTGFGPYSGAGKGILGAAGITSVGSAGSPANNAVKAYSIPIHIGGQEKYRVSITNPQGIAQPVTFEVNNPSNVTTLMVMMRIYLDGLYKRPVS